MMKHTNIAHYFLLLLILLVTYVFVSSLPHLHNSWHNSCLLAASGDLLVVMMVMTMIWTVMVMTIIVTVTVMVTVMTMIVMVIF